MRAAGLLLAIALPAFAQTWPAKPVRIVVPYDPGGAVDVTARLYSPRLSAALGQPVVVENRPGAAGKVGAEAVSRMEPDGYTVLYTAGGTLSTWQANPATPETVRNLTPIASAVTSVGAIAVRPDLPAKSIGELLELAKRSPGKLTYASSGVGSFQHLVGERLKRHGVDMIHVPYKGLAPAMTALAAGQIDVAITNLATGLPLANQGKVRLVALTQSSRFDAAPSVPAITEAMPKFDMPAPWYGFFGPPKLPRPIVARLNGEIAKALVAPEVKSKLTDISMVAVVADPDQFAAMFRETAAIYQDIIKAANITLE
jgi:tripartite-type tricarboxylate transporter receptor subunit TctC